MDREVKVINSGTYKKLKMLQGYKKIETVYERNLDG